MGSFPALAVKQPESIVDQLGQVMQLKNLADQQQVHQQQMVTGTQQLEEGKISLENARIAQVERQTIMDSFQKNKGDLGATIQDAAASGKVTPTTLLKMQTDHLKMQTDLATKDEKTLKNAADSGDMFAGALDAVKQAPLAQRPDALKQQLQQLSARGVDVSKVAQTVSALPDLSDETLNGIEASLQGHNKAVTEELKRRDTAATEQGKNIEALSFAAKQPGGTQENPEQKYIRLQQQSSQGKLAPADQAWVQGYEKNKKLVPAYNFSLQGGGEAAPTANDPLVQSVANGSMKIGDVLTPRTPLPLRKQFLQSVLQANPDFRSADYDIEKGVMKSATSGDIGKNLTAFNTAMEHAKQLQSAADALDGGDMPTLNKIGQALGYQFGSDKTTNFNVIKNALAGEISKVFKGGQATDAEIKSVEQPFSAANSPAQLKGAITNAINLMKSKRDALQQQVEQGMKGKANFGAADSGHVPGGKANGLTEGQTGTGSDGKKYVVKGGVWVQQ